MYFSVNDNSFWLVKKKLCNSDYINLKNLIFSVRKIFSNSLDSCNSNDTLPWLDCMERYMIPDFFFFLGGVLLKSRLSRIALALWWKWKERTRRKIFLLDKVSCNCKATKKDIGDIFCFHSNTFFETNCSHRRIFFITLCCQSKNFIWTFLCQNKAFVRCWNKVFVRSNFFLMVCWFQSKTAFCKLAIGPRSLFKNFCVEVNFIVYIFI